MHSAGFHPTDLLTLLPGFALSTAGPGGALSQARVRGAEANHLLVMIERHPGQRSGRWIRVRFRELGPCRNRAHRIPRRPAKCGLGKRCDHGRPAVRHHATRRRAALARGGVTDRLIRPIPTSPPPRSRTGAMPKPCSDTSRATGPMQHETGLKTMASPIPRSIPAPVGTAAIGTCRSSPGRPRRMPSTTLRRRRRNLLDPPAVEHRDPISHDHRFLLVVRNVDHGHAQRPLDAANLELHFLPKTPVQGAQGFVHQHQFGLEYQGASNRDPLLLAPRELARATVFEAFETHQPKGLLHKIARLHLVHAAQSNGDDRLAPTVMCGNNA